jgi:hypothetical protein
MTINFFSGFSKFSPDEIFQALENKLGPAVRRTHLLRREQIMKTS